MMRMRSLLVLSVAVNSAAAVTVVQDGYLRASTSSTLRVEMTQQRVQAPAIAAAPAAAVAVAPTAAVAEAPAVAVAAAPEVDPDIAAFDSFDKSEIRLDKEEPTSPPVTAAVAEAPVAAPAAVPAAAPVAVDAAAPAATFNSIADRVVKKISEHVDNAKSVHQKVKEQVLAKAGGTWPGWMKSIWEDKKADPAPPNVTKAKCGPACRYKCDNPTCKQAQTCSPICEPPICETSCSASDDKCQTRCGEPQCAVVCPQSECFGDQCEQVKCLSVCGPPVCTTSCGNICHTKCAKPKCRWDCVSNKDCPKPTCDMVCNGLEGCRSDPKPVLNGVLSSQTTADAFAIAKKWGMNLPTVDGGSKIPGAGDPQTEWGLPPSADIKTPIPNIATVGNTNDNPVRQQVVWGNRVKAAEGYATLDAKDLLQKAPTPMPLPKEDQDQQTPKAPFKAINDAGIKLNKQENREALKWLPGDAFKAPGPVAVQKGQPMKPQ